jgi:multisubunit Na+/H+ antiporter MnhC subunit
MNTPLIMTVMLLSTLVIGLSMFAFAIKKASNERAN